MKLQATTDYAIRVMCFLYARQDIITAQELAEELCISHQYLYRILRQLRDSNMIEVVQGRGGGYRIMEEIGSLTLYDVIKCMEGDIQINVCLSRNGYCSRNAIDTCPVHTVLESTQKGLIESLDNIKLSEISYGYR